MCGVSIFKKRRMTMVKKFFFHNKILFLLSATLFLFFLVRGVVKSTKIKGSGIAKIHQPIVEELKQILQVKPQIKEALELSLQK